MSEFDLLAASLRADVGDLKVFVEALATKLTASFPEHVKVERKGSLFGGPKRLRRLNVSLGDREFELEQDEGRVTTRCKNVVRGIALKTEELPLDGWIDQLSSELAAQAARSDHDRAALERLLEA